MIRALAIVIALAACGNHDAASTTPPAQPPVAPAGPPSGPPMPIDAATTSDAAAPADAAVATSNLGKHGDVCQLGERHRQAEPRAKVVECGPGLSCCYPCGMAGCDSVCHTPAECDTDKMRP